MPPNSKPIPTTAAARPPPAPPVSLSSGTPGGAMLYRRHHLLPPSMTHLLLLFLLVPRFALSLNQEGLYLLQFKRGLDDPSGALSGWNPRDPSPCGWAGVSCSGDGSVAGLELDNLSLQGPFHPLLCRLPNLSSISLTLNYINSTLPDAALSPCPALVHLDLSQNNLVGPLPSALASLPLLRHLDLSSNNFSGAIPAAFGRFPRLENLSLFSNLLSGAVPGFLGQVASLQRLDLAYNPFSPARIPPEIGNLASLRNLWLAGCNLVGVIPPSLGRLRSLLNLDVSGNKLDGPIPESLAGLSSIVQIELYGNALTGEIPSGLAELASLRRIDASMNRLEGSIPAAFFELPHLESFHLYQNRLVGGLPASIGRAGKLADLKLFQNQLNGSLPADLGKNSPLVVVDLSENLFSGEIPRSICDQGSLQELMILENFLSGTLPDGLARCRTLQRVRLGNNLLSGIVPPGMWGLPHVSLLDLAGNSLSGEISPAISGARNLSNLILSNNHFTGSIPAGMGDVLQLHQLSADSNRLTGPLPPALGKLAMLGKLDLHNNSLSGELPREIQACKSLSELNLASNGFTGKIPPELGSLPDLNYLDLSDNLLTGEIPPELQNLKLNRFNLSNNQLSGDLPRLYANPTYRDSFLGNPGLCGDLEGLCTKTQGGGRGYVWLLRSIFILAAVVLLVGVAWFYWRYRKFREAKREADRSKWTLTSFHKLGFKEYEIVDCLDEDNLIGSGASGKVYKAVLSNGETVAVKKLWGSSKKGEGDGADPENPTVGDAFEAEIATLGKIRHKNIVKLWCCCTHGDCRLLVYEYMPNGSLGDLLHSSKGGLLDWPTRYKVALDAAEGLSYLHHDCAPPIVHRDVKSNNILLDAEFGARVADFGVAKAVEAGGGKGANKSMSVIAGSCGYIAPEYAYTLRVNEKSDIYSFGVVLLELVTGKPPIDPEFGEKDLVKWVCGTLEQKGVEHVLDPKLDVCFKEDIFKVLNIALLCTSNLPINRPAMRRVVKMLLEAGAATSNKTKSEKKDGKLSPYYYEDTSGP
uniref:non-specific serine/threonine protein kinase n=1 Tax=Anthurium amnicola TaxID=1678845 RepID=A0A1D1YJL0_9ARAE